MKQHTIGLYGQTARVISLFRLYRETGEEEWKEQAEDLLEALWENYETAEPWSYGHGFIGLGAGTEYLIQNGFAEGDADEILAEIDALAVNLINARVPLDLTVENGILGLACYLYYRLCYRTGSADERVLVLKEHTLYLIDWIADSMQDPAIPRNYYEVYFILVMLHRLNLFNAKIEHLIHRCNQELSTLQS